ncbi:MAG: DUF4965 domain-containing protein, partial [Chloroflexi bacterium]|nr:DUF4965 domain-containing protein [Chloroflexota bacterium]
MSSAMALYDSIIPCFGSRFTVVMMPHARRYRVFPLGTFHYFDWQKTETVGVGIGTCPQIVSSETARIGVRVGEVTRILPFDDGDVFPAEFFSAMEQTITPLQTSIHTTDSDLPVRAAFRFRSLFYPQSFAFSCAPGYVLDVEVTNPTAQPVEAEIFFSLPLANAELRDDAVHSRTAITFPDGVDHTGIDGLTFEQIMAVDGGHASMTDSQPELRASIHLQPGKTQIVRFYHVGYIAQPTLNQQGNLLRFGYTTLWDDAQAVLEWMRSNRDQIERKADLFESTVLQATVPPELKLLLSSAFKGLASNAWWAESGWFSVMEIGAYHATLDVDFQLALFFFQYWPQLVGRMLDQWAAYYRPGSGYMAHDVGQHLEALGNRYGGPHSAMKVEENCNYLILLHHYWRATGDARILADKHRLITELVDFLMAADTTGSGLPNRDADNTNDWGSGLITTSEEQSYHGVRLVAAYAAVAQIAEHFGDPALKERCQQQTDLIVRTLNSAWLGDHYPISLADSASYHHYSMWTTHGLLYALRGGLALPLDMGKLRTDLIASTQRTMREHGCAHSTVDVRGWLTQNLWRDCITAYLGVDLLSNLRRYLGHGEYVSYEDTTILEVANELMVVPGAIAAHTHAGEIHDFPMVDGHPRPACGFGLLYALGGVQFDGIAGRLHFCPASFPLRIALTHLADWSQGVVPWATFTRSIPNQDQGAQPQA